MEKKNRNSYDLFVKEARAAGFIDSQIDFLWDWIYFAAADPETFTHDDNKAEEESWAESLEKICEVSESGQRYSNDRVDIEKLKSLIHKALLQKEKEVRAEGITCQSCKTRNLSLTCCPACIPNPSFSQVEVDKARQEVRAEMVEMVEKLNSPYASPNMTSEGCNLDRVYRKAKDDIIKILLSKGGE